ncbi:MAG: hypothetical protein COT17_08270 [Elusimicrobia bacterium CG08_land_8_20_14_0_20_51_18]|nr:MAG: hypothetical protein COT17_08270 [Elusimicrobia bacterium CG08_land_8_20_14_0_20_51_18]
MEKIKKYFPVILLSLLGAFIHFYGLDAGTPSPLKTGNIFRPGELAVYVPEMIELRDKYYSAIREMMAGKKDLEKTSKELFFHNLKSGPYGEMSEELKLDAMRNFFIGVATTDEQQAMAGISRLDPLKLDFNPDDYIYGGFYFHSAAAFLVLGKLAGLISLNPSAEYYFSRPEEVRNMYVLVRSFSALAGLLGALLLFCMVRRDYGGKAAFLAALFALMSPLLLYNGHEAKPHNYAFLWTLLGVYFCRRLTFSEDVKNYLLAGAAFGLAGGSLLPNLMLFSVLLFAEWGKRRSFPGMINKKVLYAAAACFAAFFVTNHYLFFDLKTFLIKYRETSLLWGYGKLWNWQAMNFLKDGFFWLLGFSALPAVLAGAFALYRDKTPFSRTLLYSPVFLYLVNLLILKHTMMLIICLPFVAAMFGLGCERLIRSFRKTGLAYASLCLALFLLQGFDFINSYRSGRNLLSAGEWINANIPRGNSIGVFGGWFNSGSLPPFHYLEYRLIHWPEDSAALSRDREKLPGYLLLPRRRLTPEVSVYVREYYSELKAFGGESFFSKIFPIRENYIKAEIEPFFIFKLTRKF